MPRRCYPTLDIQHALQDADAALRDVLTYLEILEHTNGVNTPEGTATLYGNVRAVRCLLGWAVPQPLAQTMAQEQRDCDAAEAYLGNR
jgi:hypothetical protein